ncbi:MAG: thioredoxin fold domain-containing protein [Gammaproteobacteria bacterium]|nr:thioredoxin fold domain-containing protein [Gammaproteobacteria bacterium]
MRIFQVLAVSLFAILAFAGVGNSATTSLPLTTDLQADGQLALKKQLPILIVFTAEHCAYCEALESEQLRPMMISGEYDDKVIIRNLRIDTFDDVVNFDGKDIPAETLAQKHSVWVTPTIMFFDHQGNTLAPKIIGYNTPSMFGGYLDERIDASRQMMRRELASRDAQVKPAL